MDDDMTDEELQRRLDELRDRINAARRREPPPKLAGLRWMRYIAAAIVFVVVLIVWDFINRPMEASILALVCAAVAFCIVNLALWAIRKLLPR